MAFTVEDFHDLIELLGQRPEWRADLRRHVLSDDLLELPALVRQLVEAQAQTELRFRELAEGQARSDARFDRVESRLDRVDATLERLAEGQARSEERLDRVESRLDRIDATLERLAEGQARSEERLDRVDATLERLAEGQARSEERLDRVDATLERLAESQARTEIEIAKLGASQQRFEDRLGRLDGRDLEREVAEHAATYIGPFVRRLQVLGRNRLADLIDDAIDEGKMTLADRAGILRADLVMSGRRRDDGQDVYLLFEISAGVRQYDVERAAGRAGLLAKLGRPVMPFVAGLEIDTATARHASSSGVWSALRGRITPPDSG